MHTMVYCTYSNILYDQADDAESEFARSPVAADATSSSPPRRRLLLLQLSRSLRLARARATRKTSFTFSR